MLFGPENARRILVTYRDKYCIFNDDMQGTGAVSLAAVLSASDVSGIPLTDHRVVVFGSGTAGIGIADRNSVAGVVRAHIALRELHEKFGGVDLRQQGVEVIQQVVERVVKTLAVTQ